MVLVAKVLLFEGVRGVGVVVPCVFTLFTLIRYVDVLLWAWNTFVDIAKYQKTAKKTAILKHTNATAKVTLCRNRDVILREFPLASYFCINKRIILILEREQLPVHRDNPNTQSVAVSAPNKSQAEAGSPFIEFYSGDVCKENENRC